MMRPTNSPNKVKIHTKRGNETNPGKVKVLKGNDPVRSAPSRYDIEDDDNTLDTTTGKLPVEAAYVTMKRIIAETGAPIQAHGKSTYNKLSSFPTEPAVDVLLNQTWKDFFMKKLNDRPLSANSNHSRSNASFFANSRPQSAQEKSAASKEHLHRKQQEIKQHLKDIFDRLVARVEEYWQKIKIPLADRKFYRQSLLKGPPRSIDQCKEISAYICMLKAHEAATIMVLEEIMSREAAVSKCYDVIAAVQRKISRSHNSMSKLSNSAGQHALNNSGSFDSEGCSPFWKEEVLTALDEVRITTLAVIRAIQSWRRNMWRPQPFIWCNINYILKMRDDMNILETESCTKLFELLRPLKFEDLLCVVFFKPSKIMIPRSNNGSGDHSPAIGSRLQSPSLAARQARINAAIEQEHQSAPETIPGGTIHFGNVQSSAAGNGASDAEQYIQNQIHTFIEKIDRRELIAAAAVVVEEDILQNALSIENASLQSKGVFIPTLKLQNHDANLNCRSNAEASTAVAHQLLESLGTMQQKQMGSDSKSGVQRNSQYSADFSDSDNRG